MYSKLNYRIALGASQQRHLGDEFGVTSWWLPNDKNPEVAVYIEINGSLQQTHKGI